MIQEGGKEDQVAGFGSCNIYTRGNGERQPSDSRLPRSLIELYTGLLNVTGAWTLHSFGGSRMSQPEPVSFLVLNSLSIPEAAGTSGPFSMWGGTWKLYRPFTDTKFVTSLHRPSASVDFRISSIPILSFGVMAVEHWEGRRSSGVQDAPPY